MTRTKTLSVSLSRLLSCGEAAGILVRLMMAGNDLSIANQCLRSFKADFPRIRKHTQRGAQLYIVRLQCGHLREALRIVDDIRDNHQLHREVQLCSTNARRAFDRLLKCLEGGPDHKKFKDYIEILRHKTFHYDQELVMRALSDRAGRPETQFSTITAGDEPCLWRFGVADDVYDSMVCRHIWKIPRDANLREEVDAIADWQFDIFSSFMQFSQEFIDRYVREYAAK